MTRQFNNGQKAPAHSLRLLQENNMNHRKMLITVAIGSMIHL